MRIHVVTAGDTLYRLARYYQVSVARLISDNGLRYPYTLVLGQALLVTQSAISHTVQSGESAYSIARHYDISVQELYQNNPELADRLPLYPGQDLTIAFVGKKTRVLSVNGYAYPHVNRHVLRRTLPYLSYLSVFSYGVRQDGSLIPADDEELLRYAKLYQALPIMVLTSIDDTGNFSSEITIRLLEDLPFQNAVLDRLIAQMLYKGYRGLDSDFEYIPPAQTMAYQAFLQNAHQKLSQVGLFLHCALAPKTSADQVGLLYEAHRYHEIGAIVDRVLLMTYEWGYTYGPPMAVAPLPQVRRVLEYGVSEIPPEKIFMGIPNYGYLWRLPYVAQQSRAQSLGNQDAVRLAGQVGAQIFYDEVAQSPYFRFRQNGFAHEVWFEDVRSIAAKYALLDELSLLGAGYWNVMRPFAQNWSFLATQYHIKKFPNV